jgi:hypothetical protein
MLSVVAAAGSVVALVGAVVTYDDAPAVAAAFVVLAVLHTVPIALIRWARAVRANERYRRLGDLALLMTAAVLWWPEV